MNRLPRRTVLAGGALLLAGCAAPGTESSTPPAPDPEDVLLGQLIADKERAVARYAQAVGSGAGELRPFLDRHRAHLAELRRRGPSVAAPVPTAPSEPAVTVTRLREMEREAAALRLRQLDAASPALAQLIASIGACEAVHAVALPGSR